ncbi:MAG: hypothetical protein V3R51_05325 [Gammaproteobacteria bacterium]
MAKRRSKKSLVLPRDDLNLGVPMPRTGSTAYLDFLQSFRKVNSFLDYILRMVAHIESVANTAHETLLKGATPKKKAQLERDWKNRKSPLDELKKNRQFFMEIIVVRHVENYLNYLSSMLREIFVSRPETLRSSEKIDLETVLRHGSINDLVLTIAERKVENLTYSSIQDLEEFFSERFHLKLIEDDQRKVLVDAIETRNISVHNRCVINKRYIARTGNKSLPEGSLRDLGYGDVKKFAKLFATSVASIDKDARKRLKVPGRRSPKPGE